MTITTKRACLIAVLIAVLSQLHALAATHTNLIFNVSISMSTFKQNYVPVSTNLAFLRIGSGTFGTRDVADIIADAPLFRTNHLRGARLLFRVSDLGPNRTAQFILRKGTNDVDVSPYLAFGFPGTVVTSKAPAPNNTTNATDYGTFQLVLYSTPAGRFDVQGFSLVKNTSIFKGPELIQREEFPASIVATLGGTGYSGGYPTILRGTVVISGRRVEIKEGP